MTEPLGRRSAYALICAALLLLPAAFVLVTRWSVLWAGNPVFPVALCLAIASGGLLAWRGARRAVRGRRHPLLRAFGGLVAVVGCLVAAVVFLYLRPVPMTGDPAAALASDSGVTVRSTATRILLTPAQPSGTVMVFYPGARIDSRAYAGVLKQVAATGVEIHIVKEPFGMAFFDPFAAGVDLGGITAGRTAVGGHSLGGVVASAQAAALGSDLVLWASYPAFSIRDTGIAALSISGSLDGLTTPQDVSDTAALLPADTRFETVQGADHSSFGDIPHLAGDHLATTDRAQAQGQIAEITSAFLRR